MGVSAGEHHLCRSKQIFITLKMNEIKLNCRGFLSAAVSVTDHFSLITFRVVKYVLMIWLLIRPNIAVISLLIAPHYF